MEYRTKEIGPLLITDNGEFKWVLLGLLFPLIGAAIGVILYKELPKNSKKILIGAVAGLVLRSLFFMSPLWI